jgi:hypothetical protein
MSKATILDYSFRISDASTRVASSLFHKVLVIIDRKSFDKYVILFDFHDVIFDKLFGLFCRRDASTGVASFI